MNGVGEGKKKENTHVNHKGSVTLALNIVLTLSVGEWQTNGSATL